MSYIYIYITYVYVGFSPFPAIVAKWRFLGIHSLQKINFLVVTSTGKGGLAPIDAPW